MLDRNMPAIYVVGPVDSPRGDRLRTDLASHGLTSTATGGPTARSSMALVSVDQHAAVVLERRTLADGEIAAALAHRWAVSQARQDDPSWAVLLEDDAELEKSFPSTCLQIAGLECREPLAVMLYRDPRSTCRSSGIGVTWLRRTNGLPEGAVGYMLNRAALRDYPVSGPVNSVADWPYPWACRQTFLQVTPAVVRTGSQPSLVSETREPTWESMKEPCGRRARRLAETLTGVRYVRYRGVYGSWKDYRRREAGRLTYTVLARRAGR